MLTEREAGYGQLMILVISSDNAAASASIVSAG